MRILTPNDKVSLDKLFVAGVILTDILLVQDSLTNKSSDYILVILVAVWENAIKAPALLRSPKVSIPLIRATFKSINVSRVKCAEVLLASRCAVNVRMPQQMIESIKSLLESR